MKMALLSHILKVTDIFTAKDVLLIHIYTEFSPLSGLFEVYFPHL